MIHKRSTLHCKSKVTILFFLDNFLIGYDGESTIEKAVEFNMN
jgi:hypothetical protein